MSHPIRNNHFFSISLVCLIALLASCAPSTKEEMTENREVILTTENEELRNELANLRETLTATQAELSDAQIFIEENNVEQLLSAREYLRTNLKEARDELAMAQAELADAKAMAEHHDDDMAAQKEYEAKIVALNEANIELENALFNAQEKLKTAEQEFGILQRKVEREIETLKADYERQFESLGVNVNVELDSLEAQFVQAQNLNATLQAQNLELKSLNNNLRGEVAACGNNVILSSDLATLRSENVRLAQELANVQVLLVRSEERIAGISQDNVQLRGGVSSVQTEAQKAYYALQASYDALKANHDALSARCYTQPVAQPAPVAQPVAQPVVQPIVPAPTKPVMPNGEK